MTHTRTKIIPIPWWPSLGAPAGCQSVGDVHVISYRDATPRMIDHWQKRNEKCISQSETLAPKCLARLNSQCHYAKHCETSPTFTSICTPSKIDSTPVNLCICCRSLFSWIVAVHKYSFQRYLEPEEAWRAPGWNLRSPALPISLSWSWGSKFPKGRGGKGSANNSPASPSTQSLLTNPSPLNSCHNPTILDAVICITMYEDAWGTSRTITKHDK